MNINDGRLVKQTVMQALHLDALLRPTTNLKREKHACDLDAPASDTDLLYCGSS